MISSSVLLPHPLGPMMAVTLCGATRTFTSWSARTGAPDFPLYVRPMPSQAMATPDAISVLVT
jgi:hypothetical protein